MRRYYLKVPASLLLLFFLLSCAGCAGTPFKWDTARKVQVGMSKDEVKDIMGSPFRVNTEGENERWTWSWADMFSGSRAVSVVFRDGKVIGVPKIPEQF